MCSLLTGISRDVVENTDWDRGSAIILFENTSPPTYCCDGVKWDSDKDSLACIGGDEAFQLDAGKAMVGVAALKSLVLSNPDDHYASGVNISQISHSRNLFMV